MTATSTRPATANGLDAGRRSFGIGVAGTATAMLAGCCSWRPFAAPVIPGEPPASTARVFRPIVRKAAGSPELCIDVHSHFFNASDVPVKGYLTGPIAFEMKEPLRSLIRLLGDVADELSHAAPTASVEYAELMELASRSTLMNRFDMERELQRRIEAEQSRVATTFYDIVRNHPFERRFNEIVGGRRRLRAPAPGESDALSPETMLNAFRDDSDPAPRRSSQRIEESKADYPEGVVAFVGYMLSRRWVNLQTYAKAFSSDEGAFGVDHAFGALVDFDRWLDCPPLSSQEDQIKLHRLMSVMSGGYLRPIAAYNPWTAVLQGESYLARVIRAVKTHGFLGVKMYPPNGYRPFANSEDSLPRPRKGPSARDLDVALEAMWRRCTADGIPVMAHTGESMGGDDRHNQFGGPPGYARLLDQAAAPPWVQLGHFGGSGGGGTWTTSFAEQMSRPEGANVYADVGMWTDLRCIDQCGGKERLEAALRRHPVVARRLMYGTDWLMLSSERGWATYPFDIARQLPLGIASEEFFAANARQCFGRTFQRNADPQPSAEG